MRQGKGKVGVLLFTYLTQQKNGAGKLLTLKSNAVRPFAGVRGRVTFSPSHMHALSLSKTLESQSISLEVSETKKSLNPSSSSLPCLSLSFWAMQGKMRSGHAGTTSRAALYLSFSPGHFNIHLLLIFVPLLRS